MATRTDIACPQCGRSLGTIQFMIRKPSGAIAYTCPDCSYIADMSEQAVEWELLSPGQKALRVLITIVVAYGSTLGIALLVAVFGWLFLYQVGLSKSESLPVRSPWFLGFVAFVGLVAGTVQFVRWTKDDIEGSRRRMADHRYRRLLARLGYLEST